MKRTITFLIVLVSFLSTSYGQGGSVKGVVVDSDGVPLIGVAVQIEGSLSGVVTDYDGNYEIRNVPTDGVLNFSYIGMTPVTAEVHNRTIIDVTMETDAKALEEVIVIGYGTTTKRLAVGSVSSLSGEKVENTTFPNVGTALQGQVPGLIVQSSGGGVNSTPSISIRGGGTPLYVIDGIISTAETFNMLNADDIETMSFLKDASATAVYGSQAGDGIVLIQTKRGSAGDGPTVSYSGNFSISEPTVNPDRLSSLEYMEQANVVTMRESGSLAYSEEAMASIGTSYLYPDNNWQDMVFKDFAFEQMHNLSLSGGNGKTNYFVSAGYYDNSGLLKKDLESLDRMNFRSNLTNNFDKIGLTINSGLSASIQNSEVRNYSNYSALLYTTAPNQIAYLPDGSLYADGNANPMIYFEDGSGYNNQYKKNMNARIDATWKPEFVEGLSFGGLVSYDANDYLQRVWSAYPEYFSWDEETETAVSAGYFSSPSMTVKSGYAYRFDMEARIGYLNTFGKHTIDAMALYTQRQNFSDFVEASRVNYTTTAIDQIAVGPLSDMGSDGYSSEGASAGLVFRAKYNYAEKYIFEFSGRYDGNDNFADGQKWGFFPSYSAVWIMSDEKFMKNLNDRNIINFLKLRASYGTTGISSGADRFGYLSNYDFSGNYFYADSGYTEGIEEGSLVDPDNLSWYVRNSLNYGVDFAFMKNRIELSFDYFFYETDGFLASPESTYSDPLGADLPQVISETNHRREGVELVVRYKNTFGDWGIDIGANMTYYNQMYTQLDTESYDTLMNPYTRLTQQTDFYGVVYIDDGLYQTYDQLLNTPRIYGAQWTQLGEIAYVDANGDGQITDNDKRRIDETFDPHLVYGIDFNVTYKGFRLNGLIQGTGSMMTFLGSTVYKCYYQGGMYDYMADRWSPDNTDAAFPIYTNSQTFNGSNNSQISTYWFEDAKYVRLKTLSLSYDFKQKVLKDVGFIKGLTLTLSGNNLLTFSAVSDMFDPEASRIDTETLAGDGTTSLNNTIAGGGTPLYRTYSFGVNVKF